jgi:hypothetical protein
MLATSGFPTCQCCRTFPFSPCRRSPPHSPPPPASPTCSPSVSMAPPTWPPTGPPPLPVHLWDNTAPSPPPPTTPVPSPLCSQTGALEGQLTPSARFFPCHLSPCVQTRGASPPRSAPPGSPPPTSPLPHVQVALTCPLCPTSTPPLGLSPISPTTPTPLLCASYGRRCAPCSG